MRICKGCYVQATFMIRSTCTSIVLTCDVVWVPTTIIEFKKLIVLSVIHFYTLQPVLLGKVLWSAYVQQRLWDVFANCIYLHRRMGVNSSWVSVATLLYWLHLRIWDSDMQLLLLFTVKTRVLPVLTQTYYKAPLSSEAHTSKPTSKTQSEYNLKKNYSKISFAVTAKYAPDCIRTRPAAILAARKNRKYIATHQCEQYRITWPRI